jgi:pentatricopeptide repeat protein
VWLLFFQVRRVLDLMQQAGLELSDSGEVPRPLQLPSTTACRAYICRWWDAPCSWFYCRSVVHTVYTAALDAYRRSGDALKAVAVLSDMRARQLQPSAKQYNLVLRTLQAEVRLVCCWHIVLWTLLVCATVYFTLQS